MLPFSDFWTVSSQASPSSSLKQAGTHCHGSSTVAQREQTQLVSTRMRVPSLASISGSGIWHCCALWCRFQIWLRTLVAVAVVWASSSRSSLTSRLGTSICQGCGPKKTKKKGTQCHIQLCYSKCSSGTGLVRNAHTSQAPPQNCCIRACVLTAPPGDSLYTEG